MSTLTTIQIDIFNVFDPFSLLKAGLSHNDTEDSNDYGFKDSFGNALTMHSNAGDLTYDANHVPNGGMIDSFEIRDALGRSLATASLLGGVSAVTFAATVIGDSLTRYNYLVSLLDDATTGTGNAGSNYFEVGAGNDTVSMDAGDDTVVKWKSGNLTYDGGTGSDTLSFQAQDGPVYPTALAQQLIINLATGVGQNPYGGTLSLTSVENIVGTGAADQITGNDDANIVGDGLFDGGADIVNAAGGNDIVYLSSFTTAGASFNGGSGTDQLRFDLETFSNNNDAILDLLNQSANAGSFAGIAVTGFENFMVRNAGVTLNNFTFRGDNTANTVTGSVFVAGTTTENGRDFLFGRGGNDVLNGLSGRDMLDGGIGNDTLNGGAGVDLVVGGAGRDVMSGSTGNDVFDFNKTADTGKTAALRDRITDFKHNQDDINLRDIDANTKVGGNQNFKFISAQAFHNIAGEVHYRFEGASKTIVEGDTNGDGKADFMIELTGHLTLSGGDFVL